MTALAPHIWWVAAFAASIFAALYSTGNQYFKLPGKTLVFFRGFAPVLAFTPALFFIEWPRQPLFYVLPVLSSFLSLYADTRYLQGSNQYGGGVLTRLRPVTLWALFALWFIFDSGERASLMADLPRFLSIIAVLFIAVFAAMRLAKCPVSTEAFLFFGPALFAAVFVNFLVKVGMDMSPVFSGIILFPWIEGLMIALLTLAHHGWHQDLSIRHIFERKMLKAGIFLGIAMIGLIICKNFAFTYASNPAYVVAITYIAPFWVALYYKLTGHTEKADVRMGLIFVLSAIALVLLNNAG
ncbi:MAG: hypothetical protein H6868_06460 [Rhodospirillales bacterium]|nr:hypothetical protein [Rhodospirillales bacterium]